ncbi:hypothetical protein [Cumulibacter manganitolerans]|uniref:hypothetical protein n=1 Tax=Cumulibacter manganitolerans TaxID=1884992 RepID=UPI001295FC9C|nr:hypothetical protein [Cumulibacter manganitolerans]
MKDDSVANKHDESENDRWLEQIRSTPPAPGPAGAPAAGKPLDPDPWLDGPQPGGYPDPFGSTAPPDPFGAKQAAAEGPAADRTAAWEDRPGDPSRTDAEDRWQSREPVAAPAPMPTYRPSQDPAPMPTARPPGEPAPMPTYRPAADAAGPERSSDPWPPGYDIPRLAADADDDGAAEPEPRHAAKESESAWLPPSPPAHQPGAQSR